MFMDLVLLESLLNFLKSRQNVPIVVLGHIYPNVFFYCQIGNIMVAPLLLASECYINGIYSLVCMVKWGSNHDIAVKFTNSEMPIEGVPDVPPRWVSS